MLNGSVVVVIGTAVIVGIIIIMIARVLISSTERCIPLEEMID